MKTVDRPREEWTGIPVPALVDEDTFDRARQRLEDNKRFASRNSKVPSLLQDLAACSSCGYGYHRTSTTTTAGKKIYFYRCLGSDDYRYPGGASAPTGPSAPVRRPGRLGPRHRPARRPRPHPRRDQ